MLTTTDMAHTLMATAMDTTVLVCRDSMTATAMDMARDMVCGEMVDFGEAMGLATEAMGLAATEDSGTMGMDSTDGTKWTKKQQQKNLFS